MYGIHKNSIFCLSKLIKSNEWDFLILFRQQGKQKWEKKQKKFASLVMFRRAQQISSFAPPPMSCESWFELILVDGAW